MKIIKAPFPTGLFMLLLLSYANAGYSVVYSFVKSGTTQCGNIYMTFYEPLLIDDYTFSMWAEEEWGQQKYQEPMVYFLKVFRNGEEVFLPKYLQNRDEYLLGGYQFFTPSKADLGGVIETLRKGFTVEREEAVQKVDAQEAERLAAQAAKEAENIESKEGSEQNR